MSKLISGKACSVAIISILLVTIFSGCDAGIDQKTLDTMNKLIDSLNNQPGQWKDTMKGTIDELGLIGTDSAKKILAEVQSTYTDALGTSGAEADCQANYPDYLGHRLHDRMLAILHKYDPKTPEPITMPVICITNPDHVDAGPNPPQTQLLKYYGYGFNEYSKAQPFTADLEYKSGQVVNPSFGSVNVATDYMLTLNINAEDYSTVDRNQYPAVVLKWGDKKVGTDNGQSALPVLIPTPTPTPTPTPLIKSCGPYGGGSAAQFSESFQTPPTGVLIRSHEFVDSIQMIYSTGPGYRWGGGGGDDHPINLNPGEYIQGIRTWSATYVDSITIYTNMRTFGPYGGGGGGQNPVCGGPGWQVIGIFGRSGDLVDALGVTLQQR